MPDATNSEAAQINLLAFDASASPEGLRRTASEDRGPRFPCRAGVRLKDQDRILPLTAALDQSLAGDRTVLSQRRCDCARTTGYTPGGYVPDASISERCAVEIFRAVDAERTRQELIKRAAQGYLRGDKRGCHPPDPLPENIVGHRVNSCCVGFAWNHG
jgi:hypothetical protein